MKNEEKILELLLQMQGDITEIKVDQSGMKADITEIKTEQASMKAEIQKMQADMDERFDTLEASLEFAWQDISIVEKRIERHEREFHQVG